MAKLNNIIKNTPRGYRNLSSHDAQSLYLLDTGVSNSNNIYSLSTTSPGAEINNYNFILICFTYAGSGNYNAISPILLPVIYIKSIISGGIPSGADPNNFWHQIVMHVSGTSMTPVGSFRFSGSISNNKITSLSIITHTKVTGTISISAVYGINI